MARGLSIEPSQESAIDVSGGVRSNVQPYYLEKDEMYYLKNVNLDELGARKKRYGCTSYGTAGVECGGLATWIHGDATGRIVGFWDNAGWESVGDYSWEKHHGTQISLVTEHVMAAVYGRSIEKTATNTTIADETLFVHSVYNSVSNPTLQSLCMLHEDGTGTLQASMHPRSVVWWQGRLWAAGFDDPDLGPDALMWSDILDGMKWDLSRFVRIDPYKNDIIMKILPTRSAKPRLYIFKRKSIHALDVVWTSGAQIPTTENSLDTTQSQVTLLTGEIGVVAPNSVVYASGAGDSDIFFLARDGIRSLKRVEQDTAGGVGEPISDPIKDVIDRINWNYAGRATAAVFDNKLFMALPVDGSTTNNTTVVYDIPRKRWTGEYSLSPQDMIVHSFTRDGEELLLASWTSNTAEYVGTATAATSGAHLFRLLDPSSYRDPSYTPVEYEEQTRAYYFGHLGKPKRWDWVDVECTPANTTITFSIYGKVDDRGWQLLNTVSIEPNIAYPNLPEALPWDLGQSLQTRDRKSLMDLPVGKTLQIKLVTNSPAAFGTRTTRISAWALDETWED